MTGGAVGGIFGGLVGAVQAVRMRSFMVIPFSMVATGTSFGFFMGLGMTLRQIAWVKRKSKEKKDFKIIRINNQRVNDFTYTTGVETKYL